MIPLLLVGCSAPEAPLVPLTVPPWIPLQRAAGSLPVWGGHLAVDGTTAVLSDPDGDRVLIVDTATGKVGPVVALDPGSAPFRVAIYQDLAYVTLRGSGRLAEIDRVAGKVLRTDPVCAEPRGVDVDRSNGTVYVACAEGSLVIDNGIEAVAVPVGPDLRDVVVTDDEVFVSTFRAGASYRMELDGSLVHTSSSPFDVTWRMKAWNGTISQVGSNQTDQILDRSQLVNDVPPPYYGAEAGSCGPIVSSGAQLPDGASASFATPLIVDVAIDDAHYAVVSAARTADGAGPVFLLDRQDAGCVPANAGRVLPRVEGNTVAVEFDEDSRLVVQLQQPLGLLIDGRPVDLGVDTSTDPDGRAAFALFHEATAAGLACASCHGEGQDDGHVWRFKLEGDVQIARRTLPLSGSISKRAPYHWAGDLPTLSDLMLDTFTVGMQGRAVEWDEQTRLLSWLDGVRTTRVFPGATLDRIAVGEQLFRDPAVGCSGCHSGPTFTDNQLWDVRPHDDDDGPLKTPSLLGVGARTALMHDGCAADLEARFDGDIACTGGGAHGETRYLADGDVEALIAYLRTL